LSGFIETILKEKSQSKSYSFAKIHKPWLNRELIQDYLTGATTLSTTAFNVMTYRIAVKTHT